MICHTSILLCINIWSICFLWGVELSHNTLRNYCMLTTTWRFWLNPGKQTWTPSSVQKILCKPLPTDQHIHVTLQQSIIRSIQNVSTILFSFYCPCSNILTKEPSAFCLQLICYSTCPYFFTVIGKNLSEPQCNWTPSTSWLFGTNWWFLSYWLYYVTGLVHSRKPSWHFMYKLIWHL